MWTLTNTSGDARSHRPPRERRASQTRRAGPDQGRASGADPRTSAAPTRMLQTHRHRRAPASKPIVMWHPAAEPKGPDNLAGMAVGSMTLGGVAARNSGLGGGRPNCDVRGEAAVVVHGLGLELTDANTDDACTLRGNPDVVAHLVEVSGVHTAAPPVASGAEICFVGIDSAAVYAAAARHPGAHPIVMPAGAELLSKIVWGSRHGPVMGQVIEIADGPGSRNSAAVVAGTAKAMGDHGWSVAILDADPSSDTCWAAPGGLRWPAVLAAIEDGPAASTLELLPRLAGAYLVTFPPDTGGELGEESLSLAVAAFSRAVDVVLVDRGPVSLRALSAADGARRHGERIVCLQRPWAAAGGGAGGLVVGPGWSVVGVGPRGCDSRTEAAKVGAAWAGSIQGRRVVAGARALARKLWIPQMEEGRSIGHMVAGGSRRAA